MIGVSIIDFIGQMENGIGVILSLTIDEDAYEMVYWFDKTNRYHLKIEKSFLEKYNLKSIYDAQYLDELIKYIDYKVLPPREDMYKEFKL